MRAFIRSRLAGGGLNPTLDEVRGAFPGASSFLVKRMFDEILSTLPLEAWCEAALSDDIAGICFQPDPVSPGSKKGTQLSEDLTESARQLLAENLQSDLVDLTHSFSLLDREFKRRPLPIMEQNLLKSTGTGYTTAVRRGDVCLTQTYMEELHRWSKQQYVGH